MKHCTLIMEKGKDTPIKKIGFESIQYQDRDYFVAFDGEIYNEKMLLDIFEQHQFIQPQNIEEIIFYAYVLWNEDMMQYLEGAYSFMILNEDSALIVKDPLGLRPLFFRDDDDAIYISNSLEQIMKLQHQFPVLDKNGIIDLFSFGPSCCEDQTIVQGIQALPMGSLLRIGNQQIEIEEYYQLPIYEHQDNLEVTQQKIHELLCQSIHNQSEGAKASFLSGGLDSSIISGYCAKEKKNWKTFSLDYEGNSDSFKANDFQVSSDKSFIDAMLAASPCTHKELLISQKELLDYLEPAMIARNMPGMADVDSSLLWLCKQVAQEEKIVLSGECSDEIFGGYPWFYRDEYADMQTFPWLRYVDSRIELLHPSIKKYDYQERIQSRYQQCVDRVTFLESDNEKDKKARVDTMLCLHYFMQTLVTRQVCMGEAANVKIRAPFANVKLLEYVYNIPWSMKFLNKEEKGILRNAFENELPSCIAHRKKNPFPKTHNPLYANMIASLLQESLHDENSKLPMLFDLAKLQELIDSKGESYELPWYGQLMSGPQLLAYIYQLDKWLQHYHVQVEIA